jgi:Effector-associated domain 1
MRLKYAPSVILADLVFPLGPPERTALRDAILEAFNIDSLEIAVHDVLRFRLSDVVSPTKGFETVAFKVIKHCDQLGRMRDLVVMVVNRRPELPEELARLQRRT